MCDDVFEAVAYGYIEDWQGGIIADISSTRRENNQQIENLQKAILNVFISAKPSTELAAESLARSVVDSGFIVEQSSLFTDMEFVIPLINEKTALYEAAKKITAKRINDLRKIPEMMKLCNDFYHLNQSHEETLSGDQRLADRLRVAAAVHGILLATWDKKGFVSERLEKKAERFHNLTSSILGGKHDACLVDTLRRRDYDDGVREAFVRYILNGGENNIKQRVVEIKEAQLQGVRKQGIKWLTKHLAVEWIQEIESHAVDFYAQAEK